MLGTREVPHGRRCRHRAQLLTGQRVVDGGRPIHLVDLDRQVTGSNDEARQLPDVLTGGDVDDLVPLTTLVGNATNPFPTVGEYWFGGSSGTTWTGRFPTLLSGVLVEGA